MKRTGVVKFWHEEKGYGFIIDSEDKKEYYTRIKNLTAGHSRLFNGNMVEFETKENCGPDKNQIHAVNVKII